jgi:integrase
LGNNEYYPDFIKSIKVKAQLTPIKLEELLTEEDIVKMLKACGGNDIIAIEQRALLMTIVDSGARISEILNIKLKDIIVDSYGYTLGLDGKTGYRQIRLVKAVPYLKQWLNLRTGDENTPLFTNFEKNTGNGLSYCEVYRFMQSLKRKSGVKKAVNPHKLRHRRATEMSISGFNEKELNIQFGWTDNANTSKRYNHSNAATVGDKLLVQEGIPLREKKKTSGLKARICPSCGNNTLPHNDFCACGQILVIKKPDVKQITKDNVENALQGIVNDKELSKEFHTLLQKFVDKQN